MIIKSHGVRAGTASRVVGYVLALGGNECVEALQDGSEALLDADLFAQVADHKNSILHITISPDQEIDQIELGQVVSAINNEFGFDPDDPMLLVRHISQRQNGNKLSHFHLLKPAANCNGKVYDTYRSKKKDETVSRFMEIELGHQIVPGKHNDFVHERFIERGLLEHADKLAHLTERKPVSLFGSKQIRKADRLEFDLKQFTSELKKIGALPTEQRASGLACLMSKHVDLTIEAGQRKSRLLIKQNGTVLLNANRILKIRAADVSELLENTQKEIQIGKSKLRNSSGQALANRADIEGIGARAKISEGGDPISSEARTIGREGAVPRSHRNTDTKSANDNSRQSHSEKQHGRVSAFVRKYQSRWIVRQFSAAVSKCKPMVDDLKAVARDYREASAEPLPDLSDPFLMTKLSRMLAKSLDVPRIV